MAVVGLRQPQQAETVAVAARPKADLHRLMARARHLPLHNLRSLRLLLVVVAEVTARQTQAQAALVAMLPRDLPASLALVSHQVMQRFRFWSARRPDAAVMAAMQQVVAQAAMQPAGAA